MVIRKLPKYIILSFVLFSVGVMARAETRQTSDVNIRLNNAVNECIEITPTTQEARNNLILLDTKIVSKKSAGYCGCKSALLSYSVLMESPAGNKTIGEYGTFSSLRTGKFTFVVDRNYSPTEKVKAFELNIQCAPPE